MKLSLILDCSLIELSIMKNSEVVIETNHDNSVHDQESISSGVVAVVVHDKEIATTTTSSSSSSSSDSTSNCSSSLIINSLQPNIVEKISCFVDITEECKRIAATLSDETPMIAYRHYNLLDSMSAVEVGIPEWMVDWWIDAWMNI
jgi:hypothetical protein